MSSFFELICHNFIFIPPTFKIQIQFFFSYFFLHIQNMSVIPELNRDL